MDIDLEDGLKSIEDVFSVLEECCAVSMISSPNYDGPSVSSPVKERLDTERIDDSQKKNKLLVEDSFTWLNNDMDTSEFDITNEMFDDLL